LQAVVELFDRLVRFAIGRLKPGGGFEFGARTRSWKRRKQTRNTYRPSGFPLLGDSYPVKASEK